MMTQTPEQYAEMIIAEYYKNRIETPYNLAIAISRIAVKYSKWLDASSDRAMWATDYSNEAYVAEKQHEANTKCQAYRLALITLTDKLRK
jgi:hypothetical protein